MLAHLVGWLKRARLGSVSWSRRKRIAAADNFRGYGVELVIEPDLLSDPAHAALRSIILPVSISLLPNTIAAYRAVQAAQLEHAPVLWYLHETLVAMQLMEKIPDLLPALGISGCACHADRSRRRNLSSVYGSPDSRAAAWISRSRKARCRAGHPFTFVTIATYERAKVRMFCSKRSRELHPDLRWRALFLDGGTHAPIGKTISRCSQRKERIDCECSIARAAES